jgi:GntR family transcriptional regulator/MocR family aminotransferase
VIDYLADYRRIIDRQGDSILENTVAELLADGTIQKHLRQSLKAYRQRRDYFCGAMKAVLGDKVAFQVPEGGLDKI